MKTQIICRQNGKIKAHVHCVIVGFSIVPNDTKKRIYDGERYQEAENINAIGIHPKEQQIEDHSSPQATATAPRMPQLVVGRP